ncbi:hypothetical protein [Kineococcus rhizosphaerae]|uniref:hypothetical protein n=1 Tax=Kineococcus rhizosphaerae TaxID=559628 RepID=UPI0011B24E70|nr:hypothetical protein [Kineococcus rhizosphaerae]
MAVAAYGEVRDQSALKPARTRWTGAHDSVSRCCKPEGCDTLAGAPASHDEITARLLAVANDPERPKAYRHLARGAASGDIVLCGDGRGGHRRALEASLELWEKHTPDAQEVAALERTLFGDDRPWWRRWWSSASQRRHND